MKQVLASISTFCGCLLIMMSSASSALAQTSVGIELGANQNRELGTMTCDCGAQFNGGTGNGFAASAFAEFPFGHNFFVGAKFGFDLKKWTSSTRELDSIIVNYGTIDNPRVDSVSMYFGHNGTVSLSLVRISPFVQYQMGGTSLFVQGASTVSYVSHTEFTQTRQLLTNSVTLHDGTQVSNITLANGQQSETIEQGPISNSNSILFSAVFSLGYDFGFGAFSVAPLLSYELPFSRVQSSESWNTTSLYGSLELKFTP